MAHWRQVIPRDRLLEIDYEALIANRETLTRRMIEFVGLEWDEACLRPENNRRAVNTASLWQARQPVYGTSVGRWRRYEPWLGEFRQLLTDNSSPPGSTESGPRSNAERQLAERLRWQGRHSEAISVLQQVVRRGLFDPAIYNDLGLTLLENGQVAEAVESLERAIALDPDFALGQYNFGAALERQRRRSDAIAAYRRCTTLDPGFAAAFSRLGDLLYAMGDRAQALDCFSRAVAASPASTLGRLNRTKCLLVAEKLVEAEESLRKTIADDPQSSEAHRLLGNILRESGRFDEAAACLERAVVIDPELISAYHDLVQSKKITDADRPLLAQMASLLERVGFTDHERVLLHFALGKAFDDLAAHDQAICHFDAGNRLEHRDLTFDRAQFAEGVDRLVARFARDYFARQAGLGSDCATPILIIGMPRSGTTLVEQIISSHSQVAAAGELTFWQQREPDWAAAGADGVTASSAREIAEEYLSLLRRASPDAPRVTDKMPFNFLYAGLIHSVLPNARIIHCRRHPIDTCLSIYFTRFATPQEFATIAAISLSTISTMRG